MAEARKRKWDQPALDEENPQKVSRTEDVKSATEAAAAAVCHIPKNIILSFSPNLGIH